MPVICLNYRGGQVLGQSAAAPELRWSAEVWALGQRGPQAFTAQRLCPENISERHVCLFVCLFACLVFFKRKNSAQKSSIVFFCKKKIF